jgi:Ca2+/Na+ antiporter
MIEIALWSPFLVSGGVVVIAGLLIGRVSGELGERLKLGRVWAGTVLISLATTTPELVTTATVAFHGQAGMAIGGVLGSVVFNLLILVLMDLADPDPIYHRLSFNHLSTGLLGCVLLGVVIVAIALGLDGVRAAAPGFPRLGLASVALLGFFSLGQFVLFQMATKSANGETPIHTRNLFDRFSLKWILFAYVLLIVIIFISARGLALSVEQLAGEYRLGATFAGAVLLGVVTSLARINQRDRVCAPKGNRPRHGKPLGRQRDGPDGSRRGGLLFTQPSFRVLVDHGGSLIPYHGWHRDRDAGRRSGGLGDPQRPSGLANRRRVADTCRALRSKPDHLLSVWGIKNEIILARTHIGRNRAATGNTVARRFGRRGCRPETFPVGAE